MDFQDTPIDGLRIVRMNVFSDDRGWFGRSFCQREFAGAGMEDIVWTQMNHSFTAERGSIRGLHYQIPPFSEAKLVRCISGAVFDVAVDLRRGSSTFGNWFGTALSAANREALFIPAGFAHGFQTLEPNSELIYQHTSFYEPGFEGGIRYDDPTLGIPWPLPLTLISERDRSLPYLDPAFAGI